MKKKNIIIVFIITLIVIGIIIGGFFLTKDKLKPTKKETETKNELKKAGSFTKYVNINGNTYNYTMNFDVKDAVPSTTEPGNYDYYGQMSLLLMGSYRPIDYTWKLYTLSSDVATPNKSYLGNITVKRNFYNNNDYLIIKYYPKSEANGVLKPTTVIFKHNSNENIYKLEKQIPFPQWQVINYKGQDYDSDTGVELKMDTSDVYGDHVNDSITYYTLPEITENDGLIEEHKITFTGSGISEKVTIDKNQKGNLVISP